MCAYVWGCDNVYERDSGVVVVLLTGRRHLELRICFWEKQHSEDLFYIQMSCQRSSCSPLMSAFLHSCSIICQSYSHSQPQRNPPYMWLKTATQRRCATFRNCISFFIMRANMTFLLLLQRGAARIPKERYWEIFCHSICWYCSSCALSVWVVRSDKKPLCEAENGGRHAESLRRESAHISL